jgi:hypothetical protein
VGALLLWAGAVSASSLTRTVIRVDHATGKASLVPQTLSAETGPDPLPLWSCAWIPRKPCWKDESGRETAISNESIKALPGRPLAVEVVNTNTALYAYALEAKKFEADEIATLKTFTKGIGGYLAELAGQLVGMPDRVSTQEQSEKGLAEDREAPRLPQPVSDVQNDLRDIRDAVSGAKGLLETRTEIVASLRQMETNHDAKFAAKLLEARDALRAILKDRLKGPKTSMTPTDPEPWKGNLKAADTLSEAFRSLARHLPLLVAYNASRNFPASDFEELATAGQKVLEGSGDVLEDAFAVEKLTFLAVNALPAWTSDEFKVSLASGRDLTVTARTRKIPEFSRAATFDDLEYKLKVAPDWALRPAVGLSLVMSTGSRFPQYGAIKADTPDKFRIAETGTQDSRFTWGLTLGLTPRCLDHRETGGWAVWLPELTVNPSSDVKAVALGAGVSFLKIVRIGGGLLWTKHPALDGQSLGQLLDDAKALRTRDTYGAWHGYVGISIIGWPPFVKE